MDEQLTISVFGSLLEVDEATWDACANPESLPFDPFVSYRFLHALEVSNSVGEGTGWYPRYLKVNRGRETLGFLPSYLKTHSQGEYIFDHSWAQAYEHAGGRYFPKMQIAVPFTPATGRRFLVKPDEAALAQAALVQGAQSLAQEMNLSSIHMTFCTEQEYDAGAKLGLLQRQMQQFHWINDGYESFDDFLSALSSRKRKTIRCERKEAASFGGVIRGLTGDEIEPAHWDAFWRFYQDTGARKWGMPYLTRDFFDQIHQTMRDDIYLVLAERDGRAIAGALNFIGGTQLFGRYWGCTEHHPFLHFELCCYQAIDFAISRGLARVEAGAQGEHKLARGYLPRPTYSLHWLRNEGFSNAVEEYLIRERAAVDDEIEILTSYGPFRKPSEEDYAKEND